MGNFLQPTVIRKKQSNFEIVNHFKIQKSMHLRLTAQDKIQVELIDDISKEIAICELTEYSLRDLEFACRFVLDVIEKKKINSLDKTINYDIK